MDGRTCLVTGAAGFIGSHIVRRLVDRGASVHAVVRPGASLDRIADCKDRVTVHHADLCDPVATRAAVSAASPELVFHLASPSRGANSADIDAAKRSIKQIIKPLIGLVEALAQLPEPPRALFRAGTIAEYGAVALPYRERQRERPISAYGSAMLAGTQFLDMLQASVPFQMVTARLALTYGPDQSESFLIPALIDACLAGQSIKIERPDDRRDLIHVDDVVSAFLALAETRNVQSGYINVATGTAPSMREVAAEVISGTRCNPALVEQRRLLPGEKINELRCDASLAREMYSWSPQIGLRQGLSRLIDARRRQIGPDQHTSEVRVHG